jgi:site-specific DNA-cytosine methylase
LLCDSEAPNLMDPEQKCAPVPSPHHLVAGFPCDDASALNPHSFSIANRTCVSTSSLRTGSVLHDIILHAQQHSNHLLFLTFENVTALLRAAVDEKKQAVGPSNADVACLLLGKCLNMHIKLWRLDPRLFGSPQVRGRLYFVGVPLRKLPGNSSQDADVQFDNIMQQLVGSQATPLSEYLLPEDHPVVARYYNSVVASDAKKQGDHISAVLAGGTPVAPKGAATNKQRRLWKWPEQHRVSFERKGMDWLQVVVPDEATMRCFPGLRALHLREFDVLAYAGVIRFPENETRAIELSQCLNREEKARLEQLSTVVPEMRKYVTSRCRFILGHEALHIQDIWYPPSVGDALDSMPSDFLADLAGNAFDGSCYSAVIFSTCVFLSQGAAAREAQASSEDSDCDSLGWSSDNSLEYVGPR